MKSETTGKGKRLQLTGDRPKEHLADDRLGYANFARALARSIVELAPAEGIVLAVNGTWGSGKTTAVNMVVEALCDLQKSKEADREVIPVRFNPWWFSEQENLTRAFFGEMAAALDKKVPKKVLDGLRHVARRVAASGDLVVAGLDLVPGGGAAKAAAGVGFKILGKFANDERSLFQVREELRDALRQGQKRILVITDDIDRLPSDEIRQIFRLMKSVADLPNVIHLLIFDRDIAKRALEGSANDLGPEWYEKIVQASFDLPPAHPIDIQQIFLEGLEQLVGAAPITDRRRWGNVFHDAVAPWLRTPRDAARLLNGLLVSWPAVAGDVDLADFVALETIRLFEPTLHTFVRHNPARLTGIAREQPGEERGLGDELLHLIPPARGEQAKAALQRLFPRLESVWTNRRYASDFLTEWDRERRVCVKTRFPAYFAFGVGDEVLSRVELQQFISDIADRERVSTAVTAYAQEFRRAGGTKAAVLLEELSSNIEMIPAEDVPKAIVNLFDVADFFANVQAQRGGGLFFLPAIWRFWYMMSLLLKRLDEAAREEPLRTAFGAARSLQGLRFALTVFRASLGRDPDAKPESAGTPLITEAVFEELAAQFRERLCAASENGSLVAGGGLIENLLEWVRLGDEARVRAWTDALLDDDTDILTLAAAATQLSRAHTVGDRIVREIPTVHRPTLEKIVNVERLLARLDAIAEAGSGPEVLEVVSRFRRGLRPQGPSPDVDHADEA